MAYPEMVPPTSLQNRNIAMTPRARRQLKSPVTLRTTTHSRQPTPLTRTPSSTSNLSRHKPEVTPTALDSQGLLSVARHGSTRAAGLPAQVRSVEESPLTAPTRAGWGLTPGSTIVNRARRSDRRPSRPQVRSLAGSPLSAPTTARLTPKRQPRTMRRSRHRGANRSAHRGPGYRWRRMSTRREGGGLWDPTAPSTCRAGLYGAILGALIVERLNTVLDGVEFAILSAARGPFARSGASRIDRVTTPALRALNIEPFTAPQLTVVHRHTGRRIRVAAGSDTTAANTLASWSQIGHGLITKRRYQAARIGTATRHIYGCELDEYTLSNTGHHHLERTRDAPFARTTTLHRRSEIASRSERNSPPPANASKPPRQHAVRALRGSREPAKRSSAVPTSTTLPSLGATGRSEDQLRTEREILTQKPCSSSMRHDFPLIGRLTITIGLAPEHASPTEVCWLDAGCGHRSDTLPAVRLDLLAIFR